MGEGLQQPSFEEFVSARYGALARMGFLLLGDWGKAEDLTQEALLRTYRAWRRLHAAANAESYTRTIMVRLATRWQGRSWRAELPRAELPSAIARDVYAGVELAQTLRAALLGLPIGQRAVLVLRFYQDLTEAQTAETLGCSVGTVKSRTSRALTALRAVGVFDDESELGKGKRIGRG